MAEDPRTWVLGYDHTLGAHPFDPSGLLLPRAPTILDQNETLPLLMSEAEVGLVIELSREVLTGVSSTWRVEQGSLDGGARLEAAELRKLHVDSPGGTLIIEIFHVVYWVHQP